jgi:hypothetical protein
LRVDVGERNAAIGLPDDLADRANPARVDRRPSGIEPQ